MEEFKIRTQIIPSVNGESNHLCQLHWLIHLFILLKLKMNSFIAEHYVYEVFMTHTHNYKPGLVIGVSLSVYNSIHFC